MPGNRVQVFCSFFPLLFLNIHFFSVTIIQVIYFRDIEDEVCFRKQCRPWTKLSIPWYFILGVIFHFNSSFADHDQRLRSVASDLGLHCLPMSHKIKSSS